LGGKSLVYENYASILKKTAGILRDICPKNYQNAGIFMIFAKKVPKMPEFYMVIAREIFSGIFFFGGGRAAPGLTPVSYVYDLLAEVYMYTKKPMKLH